MDKKGKNNKLKEKINEILSSENTDVLKELIELEKETSKRCFIKTDYKSFISNCWR